jgi:hypothetical protein
MQSRRAQRDRTKPTPTPVRGGDDDERGDYRGGRLGEVVKDDERNDEGGEGGVRASGCENECGRDCKCESGSESEVKQQAKKIQDHQAKFVVTPTSNVCVCVCVFESLGSRGYR